VKKSTWRQLQDIKAVVGVVEIHYTLEIYSIKDSILYRGNSLWYMDEEVASQLLTYIDRRTLCSLRLEVD